MKIVNGEEQLTLRERAKAKAVSKTGQFKYSLAFSSPVYVATVL